MRRIIVQSGVDGRRGAGACGLRHRRQSLAGAGVHARQGHRPAAARTAARRQASWSGKIWIRCSSPRRNPRQVRVSPPQHVARGPGWTACVRAELDFRDRPAARHRKPTASRSAAASSSTGGASRPSDNCAVRELRADLAARASRRDAAAVSRTAQTRRSRPPHTSATDRRPCRRPCRASLPLPGAWRRA